VRSLYKSFDVKGLKVKFPNTFQEEKKYCMFMQECCTKICFVYTRSLSALSCH
jgi:hypothetical protein